jgi:hypothetical protein
MIKSFLLVWILLGCSLCSVHEVYAQRQTYFIAPKETDNEITTDLESHYVALNRSIPPKNLLFLFFPGTGGTPFFQQNLLNTAADLGFHAISLNYPNDQAVNRDLCVGSNADLDCYARVRLEIIDGVDRTPLLNITRANSIENRLIKLLIYLSKRFPNDGWEQYLEKDGTISWPSIVVGGHSQGGGHAGIIGRYHLVARVVMFAAMDYNGREMKPANWIALPDSTPNATPAERFYGFSHQRDQSVNFNILSRQVWPAYGMNNFGPVVNVDATAPPYNNTHSLTSNLDAPTGNYHGCIVVDRNLVLQSDGMPVYQPVWIYLLSNTTRPTPPTITSLNILRKEKPVDHLLAGVKANKYRLNLTGSGFVSGSKAMINEKEAETSLTGNKELEVKLPFQKVPDAGVLTVQVRNTDGQVSNTVTIEIRGK